jgi:hypothetical protein
MMDSTDETVCAFFIGLLEDSSHVHLRKCFYIV